MESKALSFSGGVDSTALALYLRERGIDFQPVFCDTGWEHPLTLEYIRYCDKEIFQGGLITLKNPDYPSGMADLVKKKKRVPSPRARFCTELLKVKPLIDFCQKKEVDIIYQGIRADESSSRARMPEKEWSDSFDCFVERPILRWGKQDCFEILRKNNIRINPLYSKGSLRVGCFPCVMISHRELKTMSHFFPGIWERIERLEKINNRSFFPPNYIPSKYHTGFDEKSGKSYPVFSDVRKYLRSVETRGQLSFLTSPLKCLSFYDLCE